jgi:DNA polymerase-1
MAVNAPIQGTATADIIKLALRMVDERMKADGYDDVVHPLLQVHDEIMYEIHDDVHDKAVSIITEVMESVLEKSFLEFDTPIPIKVDSVSASSWGEMKE